MDRTQASGYILNAAGKRIYGDKIPGQAQGTSLIAADRTATQEEIVGAIEASGQTPDNGNLAQLQAAIKVLGNAPVWSAAFAKLIGGYPNRFLVQDASSAGVFWISTADNNLTVPGAQGASWTNMLGDFLRMSLTTDQNVLGPVTFEESPVVPLLATSADTYQAVSAAWVNAVLANYLNLVTTNAQTVAGAITFEASPVVPLLGASVNTYQVVNAAWVNSQLANYLNINETTQQEVAGLVGFQVTPTVPTLANGTKTDQVATTKFACGTFSPGSSGYKIHPDGCIEQWGTYLTEASSGAAALHFPLVFPNVCEAVVVCEARAGGSWGSSQPTVHGVNDTPGTGGFVAVTLGWNGSTFAATKATGNYRAIGY